MSDRPTYPELLKLFYKHSFPDKLGAPGSAVAQAIIYKSNDLWFPADFTMSNRELSQLSGEKLTNIGRTRQKVVDTCIVDGKPMFIYVSNGKHKAGKYILNFNLCSGLTSTYHQKQGKIDNDPNSTLHNPTKGPPTPKTTEVTKQESSETEAGAGDSDSKEDQSIRQKAVNLQDLILRKWRSQISKAPDFGACKTALREFGWDHKLFNEAVNQAPATLTNPNPVSALNLVSSIARRMQNEGNGGVSREMIEERKLEIEELKADLVEARKKPEENEAWISQNGYLLEQKEEALEGLIRA